MSNVFPFIAAPLLKDPDPVEKTSVTGTIVELTSDSLTLDNGQTFDWAANGNLSDFRVGQRVTVTFAPNQLPVNAEIRLAD